MNVREQTRYTYLGGQSFDYKVTAGGTLAAQSGTITLNPYHYPCNYFIATNCANPTDIIPGTFTEGSNDIDVSSLTAAGDVAGISTFTQMLGKLMTHRIRPDGSSRIQTAALRR